MLKIHGVPFSAHTRKVIVAAIEKGISYETVPVIPLKPPPGWTEVSALGLIPAIQDGDFALADSSVICQYLELAFPGAPLYPSYGSRSSSTAASRRTCCAGCSCSAYSHRSSWDRRRTKN
jgi:glutathione S-transferase